jgi:hypothetical protein
VGVVIRQLVVSVVLLVAGVGVLHLLPHQTPPPAMTTPTTVTVTN